MNQKVELSKSISGSMSRLFCVAIVTFGAALAGILLPILPNFLSITIPVWLQVLGGGWTVIVLSVVIVNIVRINWKARKAIARQNERLNTMQDIALQATRTLNVAQRIGLMSLGGVGHIATKLSSVMVERSGTDEGVPHKLASFTQRTREQSRIVDRNMAEFETALHQSDLKALRKYSRDLTGKFRSG